VPSLPDHAALWAEARAAFDGDRELLGTVGAAALLLPQLILGRYGGALDPAALASADSALLVLLLVTLLGQLFAQLFASLVVLAPAAPTGAALIARAARLLPAGLLASLAQSACLVPAIALLLSPAPPAKLAGLVVLVPGLYLFTRLALALPALAGGAEGAVVALRLSFERTAGQVAALAGRLLPVLAGFILLLMLLGVLLAILLAGSPPDAWGPARWIGLLLSTATGAMMTILLALILAILWRALDGQAPRRLG